ncbi:transposable element Tcb2 transposase [Trichonephila clavipes]|nr:transposable element Tcb2 transposase [Trichonephila clavipes]
MPFLFDCEEVLRPVDRRDIIYMETGLTAPFTNQSSRRPSHHTTRPNRANSLIGRCPDAGITFTKGLVLPLMAGFQGAILKQDIAQPHRERLSQDCLCHITTLSWSAHSPNLSPIEHIREHFGRLVEQPTSLVELEARLQQQWNGVSRDIIRSLYGTMPTHIAS